MEFEPIVAMLNILPLTPLIRRHLPLKEMGIQALGEDKILDIYNFTIDHLKHKITLERSKYFPNEPDRPISINHKKDIIAKYNNQSKRNSFRKKGFCSSYGEEY